MAMALESNLWETLPKDLLYLVFARLPLTGIAQLRVLSKEWKKNIDWKHSEFNRVFNLTTQLEMFALMSWDEDGNSFVSLNNVQTNKWYVLRKLDNFSTVTNTLIADGGLFCNPWQRLSDEGYVQLVVVNPLTQKKMRLPPLLSMGGGESHVMVKMAQFTMDRKTKEYKLHVLCYMETNGNGLFAQTYDFHKKEWSMVESREGRIIGWERTDDLDILGPCVYNYVDRKLQHFTPLEISLGLMVVEVCIELINDHLFVLHEEAPPSSTNLMQDGEGISRNYCISEFHLPEKATTWVKLREHKCDPSIYFSPQEDYKLSLLACNGFLAVRFRKYEQDYDQLWLYNLSTCVWHNLPNLEWDVDHYLSAVLCKISWNALP